MKTLLLDRTTWDFCLDVSHNIAVASDPYSTAQDIASAVRTFLAECWYDTTQGIRYFQQILGKLPPIQVIKSGILNAANTVPGVNNAVCYLTNLSYTTREISGQIQFVDVNGNLQVANF